MGEYLAAASRQQLCRFCTWPHGVLCLGWAPVPQDAAAFEALHARPCCCGLVATVLLCSMLMLSLAGDSAGRWCQVHSWWATASRVLCFCQAVAYIAGAIVSAVSLSYVSTRNVAWLHTYTTECTMCAHHTSSLPRLDHSNMYPHVLIWLKIRPTSYIYWNHWKSEPRFV